VNEGQRRLAERRASVEKEVREIVKRDQLGRVVVVVVVGVVGVGVGVIALLKEENRRKFHRKTKEKVVSNRFVFALSHPPAGLKRRSSLPR
jgi:hypothetical protein